MTLSLLTTEVTALHLQVGLGELVPAVRHLVEYERNSLAAADTIAAAEGVVAAQPDVLLHRIVAQFQHLFDCHRLEGVLPALNQVRCSFPLSSLWQAIATTRAGFATMLTMASSRHHTRETLFVADYGTPLPPHAKIGLQGCDCLSQAVAMWKGETFKTTSYMSAVIDSDDKRIFP